MWIVSWDPFLKKKVLKSEICGSMNSAWMHCSRLTWSNSAAGTKKKKKKQKTPNTGFSWNQTGTKCPNGLLFNAQRVEPKWAEMIRKEIEWGPRKTSLSPTQTQLHPLAHWLSSYYLRGEKVYKHICKRISNQCRTQA